MSKKIINKADTENEQEFISLEWASNTGAEYLQLLQDYMKSMMLSENAVERAKYYDSAKDALARLVVPLEMVGMLGEPEELFENWFGESVAPNVALVDG